MASILLLNFLEWLVIIGLTLGSVLIILNFYFTHKTNEQKPVETDRSEERKILLPLRLQACERFILFLERISPANIAMRLNKPGYTATQLQTEILKTIREEFEYNLAQQLYISVPAWELIKTAKEESIRMVNAASSTITEGGNGNELIKSILEQTLASDYAPIDLAIKEVKKEIQGLF